MNTRRKRSQGGFTMIEVMVALLLTAIATIGLLGLYRVQTRSSSYSRRSTEATMLAADRMERLRAMATPISSISPEVIDATGTAVTGAPYTRSWTVNTVGSTYDITVLVSFDDDGTKTVTLRSFRGI